MIFFLLNFSFFFLGPRLRGRRSHCPVVAPHAWSDTVLAVAAADRQRSGRILILERLDYALFDLVLGHFAQRLQLRLGRLFQPPGHVRRLANLGGWPVPVAGPPDLLHLDDPGQRGRRRRRGRFVVRLAARDRLLFAVDHHPGRSLRVTRFTRRYPQVGPRRRRVRRETRPEKMTIYHYNEIVALSRAAFVSRARHGQR